MGSIEEEREEDKRVQQTWQIEQLHERVKDNIVID